MNKPLAVALMSSVLTLPFAWGCALTSKADPNVFHYFTPEGLDVPATAASGAKATGDASAIQLRLGRVTSAAYLHEDIAYRDSSFEVSYLEDARWTERPDVFVRRALARVLFEQRGMHQSVSSGGTTIDVELSAFEEVRAPRHAVRIQMTWVLRDDQAVRVEETFTIERPLSSKGAATPSDIARAMAAALDEAVNRIATRTTEAIGQSSAKASAP